MRITYIYVRSVRTNQIRRIRHNLFLFLSLLPLTRPFLHDSEEMPH